MNKDFRTLKTRNDLQFSGRIKHLQICVDMKNSSLLIKFERLKNEMGMAICNCFTKHLQWSAEFSWNFSLKLSGLTNNLIYILFNSIFKTKHCIAGSGPNYLDYTAFQVKCIHCLIFKFSIEQSHVILLT